MSLPFPLVVAASRVAWVGSEWEVSDQCVFTALGTCQALGCGSMYSQTGHGCLGTAQLLLCPCLVVFKIIKPINQIINRY